MAFAQVTYPGNGSNKNFTIPFPYLAQSHVQVRLDSVLQTQTTHYIFLNATTIQFVTAPPNGSVVELKRSSGATARLVDFQDGTGLDEVSLDTDGLQGFYLSQEAFDANDLCLKLTSTNVFDAVNKRITNVATPTAAQDAATKAYVDAGNLTEATAQAVAAAGSASAAAASATAAASSATAAAGSVTSAATQATNSATSATNAASSASAAAASASQAAASASDALIAATSAAAASTAGAVSLFANGGMRIAQRGTSVAVVNNSKQFLCDRWSVETIYTTATGTISQTSETVPNSPNALAVTNFTTSVGGAVKFEQRIPADLSVRLAGSSLTIGALMFQNCGSDQVGQIEIYRPASVADDYSTTASVQGAVSGGTMVNNTWSTIQRTITLTENDCKLGLAIRFIALMGPAMTSGKIAITDARANNGTTLQPFLLDDVMLDFLKCMRFYQKGRIGWLGQGVLNAVVGNVYSYPAPLQKTPTLTFTNISNSADFSTAAATTLLSTNEYFVYKKTCTGSGVSASYIQSFTADAEI